jgi:probable phosphoglycerate mutase
MATLFLVRHGLTAQTGKVLYGRTAGIGLDRRGRAQAAELVSRFDGVKITAIYSSPLERCVETVEPLAAARRLPVRPERGLIEMDAGSWTGQRLSKLRRATAWSAVQRQPSGFAFPGGGESFPDAQDRAVAAIRAIAKRHPRGRVVIASHGDIIRLVAATFLGTPLDRFQVVVADTASVTVVVTHGDAAHVVLLNDTGGLGRFAAEPVLPWETATPTQVRG